MRHTKIVATVSDLRSDEQFLSRLFEEGVDAVRLNSAHMSVEAARDIVGRIRKLAPSVAIILDTKGPEIRTTETSAPITLEEGGLVEISFGTGRSTARRIHVNYDLFWKEVSVGATILLDDGAMELSVEDAMQGVLQCRVIVGGELGSRKSVNVPGAELHMPAVTAKDEEFFALAVTCDVDFIAHSFVRSERDIAEVQSRLGKSDVKIIAKIENRAGVDNLDRILPSCYGIMVARGDLAVEIPAPEVPLVQKRIIRACIREAKPVIIATQMLHSMMESPRPTRAEVSDVANAVIDGTDAVMLSGETAKGKYPFHAVRMMAETVRTVEGGLRSVSSDDGIEGNISTYLSKAVAQATRELPTKAIIVPTNSGYLARKVSTYRVRVPVYAKCYSSRVMRELAICYGIEASIMEPPESRDELVSHALQTLLSRGLLAPSDLIVVLAGTPGTKGSSTMIEINTVERALADKE